MKKERRSQNSIPESFPSYDAAGDFWDTHDSADFAEELSPVSVQARLERRHFEIEVDEEVARALEKKAHAQKVRTNELANELLKRDLALV